MNFFCTDADGVIVKTGHCQDDLLHLQGGAGLTVHVGQANAWTQYWDGAALRDYPPTVVAERATYRHGYRWSIAGWVDERPLAMAKQQKWSEIKKARAAAEAAGFVVGGYPFDSDPASQAAIMAAAQDMALAGGPATAAWTLADDTVVTINATQMRAVLRGLRNHIQTQRDKATNLRADIEAATTVAAVDALRW